MKKIISCLLVLMLLVSSVLALAACGESGPTPLDKAKELVFSMYKDKVSTPKDYEVVSQVMVGSDVFTITWEATNAANVKINAPADNKVKIEITQSRDADVNYTLTATVKDAKGNTKTVSFDCVIPQDKSLGNEKPVADTAFKFYLNQVELGKILYFNGKMSGEYLGTTEDPSVSPDVFAEIVDGGYRLYFMDGTTKTYIQIYKNSNDKIRPQLVTEPTMVFTYDETIKVGFATIGETQYYLGTYGTYNTFSASAASYITGSNASKIDVSQFPAKLAKTANIDIVEKTAAEKVAFEKGNLSINTEIKADSSITLDATGATYGDVTLTWEIVGETAAATIEGGKLNVTLQRVATTFKIKATITCGEESDTKEFTVAVNKISTIVPNTVETPVAGTAYKLVYFQTQKGLYYYFNGTTGNYYGNMTDVAANAVDVYREDTEGGYFIYFFDKNNVKTYIEAYMSGTYCNLKLNTETPASVWSDHAEYKVPVVTLGEETYFLGTYGSNSDLRPSKISYITQGNYVADFCTLVDTDQIADDVKVSAEKENLKAPVTNIEAVGSVDLPFEGGIYWDVAITWAVSGYEFASIVDGKLVISEIPTEDTVITLTATLAKGEATDTQTFEITIKARALTQAEIVDMAYALAKGASLNEKYTLTGVIIRIDTEYSSSYKNITVTIVVSGADKPIECYRLTAVDKDNADQLAQVAALKVGDVISVNGTLKNYSGKIEFDGYTAGGAVLTEVVANATLTDEQKAALAREDISAPANSITEAGTTALPTEDAANGATITWTVSENEYATITADGLVVSSVPENAVVVTLTASIKVGEVTITKEFSVSIAAPSQLELKGTLSFADKANRVSQSTTQQVWTQNGITLTNDKAASTSNIIDSANPVRLYASSKITVEYSGMKQIVFKCNSTSYATALQNSISDATVVVDGKNVTVTFDSAVDSFVVAKLSAQVRLDSIEVYG